MRELADGPIWLFFDIILPNRNNVFLYVPKEVYYLPELTCYKPIPLLLEWTPFI